MKQSSRPQNPEVFSSLPGAEIVLAGIKDIEVGRRSVNAAAVRLASSRLRQLGLNAPVADDETPAAHQLFHQLSEDLGDNAAHARYNAILERVASFARAAELAQRG
jgi:hypothetical protein